MRVLLQRVTRAGCEVDGQIVGAVDGADNPSGQALLALVGVTHTDGPADVARLARKTAGLRILDDERSAAQVGAPVLAVSQFTLYADTAKGRRPSWHPAAPGPVAEPLVADFVTALRGHGLHVETGRFGAHMRLHLVNDGPVTILLES